MSTVAAPPAGAAGPPAGDADLRAACAVASLPAMTPQRLAKLARAGAGGWTRLLAGLRSGGPGAVALARAALAGAPPADGQVGQEARRLAACWGAAARSLDESLLASRLSEADVTPLVAGSPGYPAALEHDPEAPAVLFRRGDPAGPGPCAVAIVGTRSATPYGRELAAELGAGLATRGVSVVSGLAIGIDAAAHEGALAAPPGEAAVPVAVVAAGLDVCYPRRNARLRERLERHGTVYGESPLGAPPEPWRFPLRNRIIAALSQVVVVVESHAGGGALHTVEAALARGVEVMAVPGSVRSRASDGTNALLAAGAQLVTGVEDVLVALARQGAPAPGSPAARPAASSTAGRRPDPSERAVLAALDSTPVTTQQLLARTGASLAELVTALDGLEAAGLVRDCGGAWSRRSGGRAG